MTSHDHNIIYYQLPPRFLLIVQDVLRWKVGQKLMCSLLEKGEIAYISIIIYILIELLKIIITPPINNAELGCVKNRCLLSRTAAV